MIAAIRVPVGVFVRVGGRAAQRAPRLVWLGPLVGLAAWLAAPLPGQDAPWEDDRCEFRREVRLDEAAAIPPVVVAEFYAPAALDPAKSRLRVFARRDAVPWRLLQRGPGGFCRLALQTLDRQRAYQIYLGAAEPVDSLKWTATAGLLLETRAWRPCDLNSADSVAKAFAAAPILGADYVPGVFHRANPFAPVGPFLSRYQGALTTPKAGVHTFFTSSQDASFLFVNGKLVVAAPGKHAPVGQARVKGEITLAEGSHAFEYLHAASGDDACMTAAWQLPGATQPAAMAPEVFGDHRVARRPADRLEHRGKGLLPDFTVQAMGDVPVLDGDAPLVRVKFTNASPGRVTLGAKTQWDFGDGQTSAEASPTHVYLHPGLYRVTLSARRGASVDEFAADVFVQPPFTPSNTKDKLDALEDYVPALAGYDWAKLDGDGLAQLTRVWLQLGDFEKAARVARVALPPGAAASDSAATSDGARLTDQHRWYIAQAVGPVLRDRLDQPAAALELWSAAGRLITSKHERALAALEAADVCLHDLLEPAKAAPFLEFAATRLPDEPGQPAARLAFLRGAWLARAGKAEEARAAFRRAASLAPNKRRPVEQNAWRGTHGHSIEAHLRAGEHAAARDVLRTWEQEFPADRADGYLSYLWGRSLASRRRHAAAIAMANELLAVNPNSPYADRLLFLAAECHDAAGEPAAAAAAYQALAVDYPGSELAAEARRRAALPKRPAPEVAPDKSPKK